WRKGSEWPWRACNGETIDSDGHYTPEVALPSRLAAGKTAPISGHRPRLAHPAGDTAIRPPPANPWCIVRRIFRPWPLQNVSYLVNGPQNACFSRNGPSDGRAIMQPHPILFCSMYTLPINPFKSGALRRVLRFRGHQ